MNRGDIVLVSLPSPAGRAGYEQTGKRPALVVHDDATSGVLSVIMIVPLTSSLGAQRFPHTIAVQPSIANGLSCPSVLLVFQLRAIDKRRIDRVVGRLEANVMEMVDAEMKNLLGL